MLFPRTFRASAMRVVALVIPLMVPSAVALACPTGGGNGDASFEPDRVDTLLQAAREADADAIQEDADARSARATAKRQRTVAASLRERARLFPEGDASSLLARAALADREAAAADSSARTHSSRAKAFKSRASKLRALAKEELLDTGGNTIL